MAIVGNFWNIQPYFLKTKLDNNNFDICKTEWNIYFTLYFEPFKYYQEPEGAFFWKKV